MNSPLIQKVESQHRKSQVAQVSPGDSVKVHYRVRELGKERVQIFEGLVIATRRLNSLQASFTVRRIVSGVGVERTFPLHSPHLVKVERLKSGKVRRAKLNFVRGLVEARKFKLKDKGISGTVWEEVAKQAEQIAEQESDSRDTDQGAEPVAETEGSGDNEPKDAQEVEPTAGRSSGESGGDVSSEEGSEDPAAQPQNEAR